MKSSFSNSLQPRYIFAIGLLICVTFIMMESEAAWPPEHLERGANVVREAMVRRKRSLSASSETASGAAQRQQLELLKDAAEYDAALMQSLVAAEQNEKRRSGQVKKGFKNMIRVGGGFGKRRYQSEYPSLSLSSSDDLYSL